ncbi:rhodanese domain-containing protein [Pycnococcus provasolii]
MAAAPQQQFQRSSSRLGFGFGFGLSSSSPGRALRALRALRAPHAVSRSSGVVGCASVDEEPHGCGGFQRCGDDIGDFVVVNFYGWYAFVKPDLVKPCKKEPLLPGDEEEEEEDEDFMQVLANEHRSFLKRFDIKGRIYLSDTGINAQYSGPVEDALAYADFVKNWQPNLPHDDNRPFEHVRVSVQPLSEQAHAFPRCIVRVKNNLLPLAGGMADLDLCAPDRKAAELTPEQWEEKLKQAESLPEEQRPLLLDVRNAYEWDLGHFDGAARPTRRRVPRHARRRHLVRQRGMGHGRAHAARQRKPSFVVVVVVVFVVVVARRSRNPHVLHGRHTMRRLQCGTSRSWIQGTAVHARGRSAQLLQAAWRGGTVLEWVALRVRRTWRGV